MSIRICISDFKKGSTYLHAYTSLQIYEGSVPKILKILTKFLIHISLTAIHIYYT